MSYFTWSQREVSDIANASCSVLLPWARPLFHVGASDVAHVGASYSPGNAMDRIKLAISKLIQNPGSFEDIKKPLTDTLTTTISNEKQLVSVVGEIFSQVRRAHTHIHTRTHSLRHTHVHARTHKIEHSCWTCARPNEHLPPSVC